MAFSAHSDPEQIKEIFDSEEELLQKAEVVAGWIRNSKHMIAFTGAGISTSAGIPDFRGPNGVWTLQAQGKTSSRGNTLSAIPTDTHMSLVELQKKKVCKYLVSQNTDGLHRRSGFEIELLSELHGNSNLEKCESCKSEFLRDIRVRTAREVHDHLTGNVCPKCKGKLHDTIINFGESLPSKPLKEAYRNAEKADLCLALGSSLTVSPANEIPEIVSKKGKLVIVNLQKTPLDNKATMRVFAKTDDFMRLIMKNLNIPIPKFVLSRGIVIKTSKTGKKIDLTVAGRDRDGIPTSIFKKVSAQVGTSLTSETEEPFTFTLHDEESSLVCVTLTFMGNYLEPDLTLEIPVKQNSSSERELELSYDPFTRTWAHRNKN